MRKMVVAAFALMSISRAEAQNVNIDIPIDKALQQIGNGVDYIVNRIDIVNDRSRRESVQVLALQLASLSGEEMGLARSLEIYVNNPNAALFSDPLLAEDAISILDNHIDGIKSQFLLIQRHMKDIDPNWALHNVSIIAEIGSFAHDGRLWYVTPDSPDGSSRQARRPRERWRNRGFPLSPVASARTRPPRSS
jgi:hypothetical protein